MLTDEQKLHNRERFISLLSRLTDCRQEELVRYLDSKNYFEAPATGQYQRSYAGGLCEYALALCHELGNVVSMYAPDKYTAEDLIKVALFRDIYRVEMYELGTKNVKNAAGEWETQIYYKTKDTRPVFGDLGFSSYMIAKDFVSLNNEQIEAICNSSYRDSRTPDIQEILKAYPLVTLTHMADMAATYIGE